MRGAGQREINGSVASLNNSSMINSSRNHVGKNLQPVKSLADISDDDPVPLKRRQSNTNQQVPVNPRKSLESHSFAVEYPDKLPTDRPH
jgi:hypothetical protein